MPTSMMHDISQVVGVASGPSSSTSKRQGRVTVHLREWKYDAQVSLQGYQSKQYVHWRCAYSSHLCLSTRLKFVLTWRKPGQCVHVGCKAPTDNQGALRRRGNQGFFWSGRMGTLWERDVMGVCVSSVLVANPERHKDHPGHYRPTEG